MFQCQRPVQSAPRCNNKQKRTRFLVTQIRKGVSDVIPKEVFIKGTNMKWASVKEMRPMQGRKQSWRNRLNQMQLFFFLSVHNKRMIGVCNYYKIMSRLQTFSLPSPICGLIFSVFIRTMGEPFEIMAEPCHVFVQAFESQKEQQDLLFFSKTSRVFISSEASTCLVFAIGNLLEINK